MKLKFSEVLASMREGGVLEELATKLKDVAKAVRETNKSGQLQITIKLKPNGKDGVTVEDVVTAKIPEHDRATSHFYIDEEGGISKHDPRQPVLEGVAN